MLLAVIGTYSFHPIPKRLVCVEELLLEIHSILSSLLSEVTVVERNNRGMFQRYMYLRLINSIACLSRQKHETVFLSLSSYSSIQKYNKYTSILVFVSIVLLILVKDIDYELFTVKA